MIVEAIPHGDGDWIYSVLAFYVYSAAVQTMPVPLPGQRWYGWLYGFLQVLGANIQNALHSKNAALVTTTITQKGDEATTVVKKIEEVKVANGKEKE